MTENGSPLDRAESRMQKADAAIDAKALGALAHDAGMCEHRDAALGLPLVMTGPDSTRRLDAITQQTAGLRREPVLGSVVQLTADPQVVIKPHDGTKPGPTTPSRKDAASLSECRARREACRVVESAAFAALLKSDLTHEQLLLLKAYNASVHETRRAALAVEHARLIVAEAELTAALTNGGAA